MAHPAVFLDRDGVLARTDVIHGKPIAVRSADRFEVFPAAPDAVRRLKEAGFRTVVVTNQPELSRGGTNAAEIEAMHAILNAAMPLDAIEICPHDEADGCACRKPKPGMLLHAAETLDLDLANSYMIGDRWRDIGAGKAAGCRTILIDAGYDEPDAAKPGAPKADWIVGDIAEAAGVILGLIR